MKTPTPLPQPITEGNRLLYTRAMLIEYGRKCFAAGQASRPNPPGPDRQSDDSSVDSLMRAMGMKR